MVRSWLHAAPLGITLPSTAPGRKITLRMLVTVLPSVLKVAILQAA
jgi:hypothetical protein